MNIGKSLQTSEDCECFTSLEVHMNYVESIINLTICRRIKAYNEAGAMDTVRLVIDSKLKYTHMYYYEILARVLLEPDDVPALVNMSDFNHQD